MCLRPSLSRAALLGLGAAFCVLVSLPARPALASTTYAVNSQADSPKLLGSGAACQSILLPDHPCTLRAAIDTANTVGTPGVTVQVPSNFVILLRSIYGALHPQVFMTIKSTGAGRATVDGQLQVGVLSVDSADTLTLADLIIQNGRRPAASGGGVLLSGTLVTNNVDFIGNQGSFTGGTIYDIGGSLTMNGGSISRGTAQSGGAIYIAFDGTMTANGTVFSSNSANSGGAIEVHGGRATLNGVTVSGNQSASLGGGVLALASGTGPSQLDVSNSTFVGNSSGAGGGAILVDQSTLTLRGSTLSGNKATTTGGGLAVSLGNAALTNDTISGNSADLGGGVYQFSGTATTRPPTAVPDAVRSTLDKLSAVRAAASDQARSSSGGGPAGAHKSTAPRRSQPDAVSLESVTIANNSAGSGGGVWNTVGAFSAHDSIVASNSATSSSPDCFGTVTSGGYNLEGLSDCAFAATGDKQNSAPGLAPLASNGGPTQTIALQAGSPALDAGDPACPPPATDQRGMSRPQGPRCDIGAFELAVPLPAPPVTGQPRQTPPAGVALLALASLVVVALIAVVAHAAFRQRSPGERDA
ncbi:choice-of-anchor Q domain-containing protein [Candidatus Nephthysia bennettiae]|uniref:choice-of-anchor Q domain-containing protein n=1 Tax=Candidatus Nephthysia bennettiae TaxID=3127016 RepID=UPI0030C782FA